MATKVLIHKFINTFIEKYEERFHSYFSPFEQEMLGSLMEEVFLSMIEDFYTEFAIKPTKEQDESNEFFDYIEKKALNSNGNWVRDLAGRLIDKKRKELEGG